MRLFSERRMFHFLRRAKQQLVSRDLAAAVSRWRSPDKADYFPIPTQLTRPGRGAPQPAARRHARSAIITAIAARAAIAARRRQTGRGRDTTVTLARRTALCGAFAAARAPAPRRGALSAE